MTDYGDKEPQPKRIRTMFSKLEKRTIFAMLVPRFHEWNLFAPNGRSAEKAPRQILVDDIHNALLAVNIFRHRDQIMRQIRDAITVVRKKLVAERDGAQVTETPDYLRDLETLLRQEFQADDHELDGSSTRSLRDEGSSLNDTEDNRYDYGMLFVPPSISDDSRDDLSHRDFSIVKNEGLDGDASHFQMQSPVHLSGPVRVDNSEVRQCELLWWQERIQNERRERELKEEEAERSRMEHDLRMEVLRTKRNYYMMKLENEKAEQTGDRKRINFDLRN